MGCWAEMMQFWLLAAVWGLCRASSAGLWQGEDDCTLPGALASVLLILIHISVFLNDWSTGSMPRGDFCASRGSVPASPDGPCAPVSPRLLTGAKFICQQSDTTIYLNLSFLACVQ